MRNFLVLTTMLVAGVVPVQAFSQTLELTVAGAQSMFDEESREGSVFVRLDRDSTIAFGEFTRAHLKQPINILVDGEVMVTPFIQAPVDAGSFPLGRLKSKEATDDLADRLRSGRSIITVTPVK